MRRAFSKTAAPTYDYDASGVALPYGTTTPPVTDFGYAGMFYEPTSGLYLTNYRPYDPVTGRFQSRDPAGENADPEGNLYPYAANDPVNANDPLGLCPTGTNGGEPPGGGPPTDGNADPMMGHNGGPSLDEAESALTDEAAGALDTEADVETVREATTESAAKGVQAGQAGAFGSLKGVTGDGLTAHHMPQAAAERTGYNEGGALVMTQAEHTGTRTFGSKGVRTLQADAKSSFRDVLARDIRDVRSITGSKYNRGLQDLIKYYQENFPDLMGK